MNSVTSMIKRGAWGKNTVQLLGGLFAVLLLCLPAFSQGSFGRILGVVTDQSGGVVAGAAVTVIDTARNVSRSLISDDAGVYNAPNLTAGNYIVRVEAKGFKKLERQGILVEVGHEIRIDLTVQPGEQNQTVTVTESVPLVETTNATLGGTLETADIADLPLNGRDYQNLMGLRPGVVLQPGGGPWTQSTNGVRPDESVWMVEGVFNSNPFDRRPVIGMPSPFTDAATILPVDAIQEFNLMENPKAEYGWNAGAVVNVGIKSGTNQLHGSAYAFGRFQDWDARNYFNVAALANGTCTAGLPVTCNQVPAQLKQFGGVAGGSIKKDKLFYFAGYEGMRSFIGAAVGTTTPLTAASTVAPSTANCSSAAVIINPTADCSLSLVDAINAAGAGVSKVSESILCPNAIGMATLPKTFACTGGLYNMIAAPSTTSTLSTFANTNTSDNGIGKLDYHVNDKNSINGMFFLGNYNATGEDHPFVDVAFTDAVPIRTWTSTASWVYTPTSTLVNEMRFGYTRTTFDFVNLDVGKFANGTSSGYLLNTGVTLVGGLPNTVISGFSQLGTASNRPQYYSPNPTYDFLDSVSVLKGKHSFKFGGEFSHMEADLTVYNNGRGTFNFGTSSGLCYSGAPALADFFCGDPASASLLAGNPAIKLNWMMAAGYIQDDWRVTPKVIINLGLRYEYLTPLQEATGLWGTFDPSLGMVQQGRGINGIYKGDHRDFEPRIGFAWDVKGNGTTVVRAGGSIIHSSYASTDFMGAFGLENDINTSPGAVPTAALITCNGLYKLACPGGGSGAATSGGTIASGAVNFNDPTKLCWNAGVTSCATSGQTTAFPSAIAACGDGIAGASGIANPCDLMAVDPNLRSPRILNYNVGITHLIGSNLSVEVSYVGNKGYNLLSFRDINQSPLGSSYCINKAHFVTPTTTALGLSPAQTAGACATGPLPAGSASSLALQEARPYYSKFPYLGFINFLGNGNYSNYNSLQVSVTKRMSHGLSFVAGYTYAHGLDNGSLNRFQGLPQDSNNLAGEYAASDYDIRNRFTISATYNIPGIKGFGQLLEGWQLNTIVNLQSAQPWMAADGIKPGPPSNNFSGTGEQADRWNINGPASSFPSGKNGSPVCGGFGTGAGPSCGYASPYGGIPLTGGALTAAIAGCMAHAVDPTTLAAGGCIASADGKAFLTPPVLGGYGDMGRNIFRDSGFHDWDMSIFKNFTFKERYGIQARWEVFNVLNHPIAANPYGAGSFVNANNQMQGLGPGAPFGAALATPDFIAGNPLIGSGSQRVMQIGLKLTF